MKHRRLLLSGLPLMGLILISSTAPVYARNGTDDNTTSTSQTTTSTSDSTTSSTTEKPEAPKPKKVETEAEHAAEKSTEGKVREKGAELLAELKKEHKDAKSKDDLKKTCESRKTGLQTKVTNINKNAQQHQDNINTVFDQVVAYQSSAKLSVANWSTLVSTATSAKAQSQASVSALATLKPTIDCNKDSVASDVANFKAATAQARTDLATYRNAVKALLTAVEAAKGV